jgi:lysophospholipid acyltransferase (LPLAT)-like uncharacterized protein
LQDFLLPSDGEITLQGDAKDRADQGMSIRQKLQNSKLLEAALSSILAGYLRICLRTTKWQAEGLDPLRAALKEGPVILVLWHSRLILAAAHWPHDACPARTLVDTSPIARLVGAIQRRFGIDPVHIRTGRSGLEVTRDVLRQIRVGNSLGLAADGPTGPAHKLQDPPLEWARITGVPVFLYAYSTRRHIQFSSWDKMMFPLPFSTGAFIYQRFEGEIPRRMDESTRKSVKKQMAKALDAVQAEADQMTGLTPQP